MRTVYVVDDKALQSLTSITRTAALTEFKRAFDFVGQAPKETPITFSVLVPSAFPEKYDQSDGVIRLNLETMLSVDASMRQQAKMAAAELRKHNANLMESNRVSTAPEPLGAASKLKFVKQLSPQKKVAVVLMAGQVSIPLVASHYADNLPVTKELIDKRRNFEDDNGEIDLAKLARYYGSTGSLKDTRYLVIIENPTTIVEWGSVDQQRVGVALGRAMAHEVRHQFVEKPRHAATGLGAESPEVLDDTNYADFSIDDRKGILSALKNLDASQKGAIVIPTFPHAIREDPDSFPF